MPQPSLQGWIYGVSDKALYADALPLNPVLPCVSTGQPKTQMFRGGGTERLSRVSAAGMPQPSLKGWIHGVSDKALCADAVPPNPVLPCVSTGQQKTQMFRGGGSRAP